MKIATITDSGFFAIEAESITVLGFCLALHPSIGKKGWSVTDPRSGFAFFSGAKSKTAARAQTHTTITTCGEDKVRNVMLSHPAAPDPETLPNYTHPESQKGLDAEQVAKQIAEIADLTLPERRAVRRALRRTGKNSGGLLVKCPSCYGEKADPLAAAAWTGLQPNPRKVSAIKAFLLPDAAKILLRKLSAHSWPKWLDKDCDALDKLGVW